MIDESAVVSRLERWARIKMQSVINSDIRENPLSEN